MLSSSSSSAPLVLQSRSHYLKRSPQKPNLDDVLKDVQQLTNIDLDVWTALGIQGVVVDMEMLQPLSASERLDWIKAVQTTGITIFGLDRRSDRTTKSGFCEIELLFDQDFEFPVVQLNNRFLLTALKDTVACLSPRPDRVVFLGHRWSDRVVSWALGCRFTAVQPTA